MFVDFSLRAADCYEIAAAALDKQNDPNRGLRAIYLNNAGNSLFGAAEEAQKATHDTIVIERKLKESRELESTAEALPKDSSWCSIS